jgi:hypothetical protein
MERKIKCACGEEFESRTMFVIHLLTLGCYDQDLNWKDKTEE